MLVTAFLDILLHIDLADKVVFRTVNTYTGFGLYDLLLVIITDGCARLKLMVKWIINYSIWFLDMFCSNLLE